MFIHIGNDTVIQSEDVVAIMDYTLITSSTIMNEMVQYASDHQLIYDEQDDESKSIIITRDLVYLSSLSVSTLKKRTSMMSMISKLDDYTEELEGFE